jgi:hypothetical protein
MMIFEGCAGRRIGHLLFATFPYPYVMLKSLGLRSNMESCD